VAEKDDPQHSDVEDARTFALLQLMSTQSARAQTLAALTPEQRKAFLDSEKRFPRMSSAGGAR